MSYDERTLSYILDQLSGKNKENPSLEPVPYSWSYEKDKKEFDQEYESFLLAKRVFDFDEELEILKKWRQRYSETDSPTEKKLMKKLDVLTKNIQIKVQKREKFYQDIAELHAARKQNDIKKQIDCYLKIYGSIGEHVCGDVYKYQKELKAKNRYLAVRERYVKGGKPRIYAELSQCIAQSIAKLYRKNAHLAAQYHENPYEWENHAKDWETTAGQQYQTKSQAIAKSNHANAEDIAPFGIDAFDTKGLYGPDSPLIKDYLLALTNPTVSQTPEVKEPIPSTMPQGPVNGGYLFSPEEMTNMIISKNQFSK